MGKKSEDKRKKRENEARSRVSSEVDDSVPIEELESQSVDSELVERLKGININSVNQLVVIGEDFGQQFSQADKQQILQGLQELMNCYKVKADVFVEQATTKFKDLGDHGTPFQKKQFEALSRTIVDYGCDSNVLGQLRNALNDESIYESYKCYSRLLKDQQNKGCSSSSSKQKKKKQKAKEKLEQQEEEKEKLEQQEEEKPATELELLEDKLRKLQDEVNKEKTRAAAELELLKQKFAVDKEQADAQIRQLKDDVKKKEDQEAALKKKFALQNQDEIRKLKEEVANVKTRSQERFNQMTREADSKLRANTKMSEAKDSALEQAIARAQVLSTELKETKVLLAKKKGLTSQLAAKEAEAEGFKRELMKTKGLMEAKERSEPSKEAEAKRQLMEAQGLKNQLATEAEGLKRELMKTKGQMEAMETKLANVVAAAQAKFANVVAAKNAELANVVAAKEELANVVADKEAELANVVADKEAELANVVADKEAELAALRLRLYEMETRFQTVDNAYSLSMGMAIDVFEDEKTAEAAAATPTEILHLMNVSAWRMDQEIKYLKEVISGLKSTLEKET